MEASDRPLCWVLVNAKTAAVLGGTSVYVRRQQGGWVNQPVPFRPLSLVIAEDGLLHAEERK